MKRSLRLGVLSLGVLLAVSAPAGLAATGDPLKPNLVPLPASDITLVTKDGGEREVRFSTTTKNIGAGPLELRGGTRENGRQNVDQRIYLEGGGYTERPAGQFDHHEGHGHIHLENYANYILQPVENLNVPERIGQKTTFCVMDTTRIDTKLPGAPKKAQYTVCESQVQGMSVGWGDRYGYLLAGQSIDVTDSPDGEYILRIVVDPLDKLLEVDESDNTSEVRISLTATSVTVLDGATRPGRPR